jgi:hypothetical protein
MSYVALRGVCVGALLSAMLLGAGLTSKESLAADKDAPKAEKKEAKERAKPRGRLPDFYSKVVTEEQKVKIYAVQDAHQDKIAALSAQMKEELAKQKAEIDAILTPEQLEKVKALVAEVTAQRATKAAAAKAETKPAAEKPAETKATVTPAKTATGSK